MIDRGRLLGYLGSSLVLILRDEDIWSVRLVDRSVVRRQRAVNLGLGVWIERYRRELDRVMLPIGARLVDEALCGGVLRKGQLEVCVSSPLSGRMSDVATDGLRSGV